MVTTFLPDRSSRQTVGVHDDRRVEHAVGVHGDDGLDVVGRDDPDGCDTRDLAGVLADLVLAVHQHADEIENGAVGEVPDTDLSDVARHPLNDAICHAADRLPGLNTTDRTSVV